MQNDFRKNIFRLLLQTLIVCVLCLAAIILIGRKITSDSKAMADLRADSVMQQNEGERLIMLQNDYKKIADNIDYVNNLLPTEDQLINFLSTIEKIAKETNNAETFHFSGDINQGSNSEPRNINFTIDLQGDISSFIAFLEKLKIIPYYVRINSFNIGSGQGISSKSQINLSGRVYLK
jgi:Tfp pilus assembly protein PilO